MSVLELHRVSKTFGSARVLADVDLSVDAQTIHGLVGLNGSGKSTIVKVLAGIHAPDVGSRILVSGQSIQLDSPKAAHAAGLRFVHQDLGLVGDLSVVDNVLMGQRYPRRAWATIDSAAAEQLTRRALDVLECDVDVQAPVSTLSMSQRTAIAIARALRDMESSAKVLILDEPTASLPAPEVAGLFRVLQTLRGRGIAILMVTHHLEEVFEGCDCVTVLRDGVNVTTELTRDLTEPQLIELLVGSELAAVSAQVHEDRPEERKVCLEVQELHTKELRGVDLSVRTGEIVGVAGLAGSGRETLLPAIFGAAHRTGTVRLEGSTIRPMRPDDSIRRGLGYLASDRAQTASLNHMSIMENLTIARIPAVFEGLFIDRRGEEQEGETWIRRLGIRPPKTSANFGRCSGGNQQKVLLGRWLRLSPTVLLADDPTQAIDVPTRQAVHALIREAAASGTSFLICSADADELAELCHRVLIMRHGHVVAELSGSRLTRDEIDALSLVADRNVYVGS